MSKLSLDALEQRASEVATTDLLSSISGGTENDCHDTPPPTDGSSSGGSTNTDPSSNPYEPSGNPLVDTVRGILWWTGL